MKNKIKQWVNMNQRRILDFNRDLVKIPSENLATSGNEKNVQMMIARVLDEMGFSVDVFSPMEVEGIRQHEAYLDGRSYDNRPNVVGTWKGNGKGKSLIFSGHMDTVPNGKETWTRDPFSGDIDGERQYGLGIFDMKGGMAAAVMSARCLKELGFIPEGDLILEFVVDEEFGGANGTLACRLRGYEADAAIIPEPTNMAVCTSSQGGMYLRIIFKGKSGRAYSGEKLINPVIAMSRFVKIVENYGEWRNQTSVVPDLYKQHPYLLTSIQGVVAGDTAYDLVDRVPSQCHLDLWLQCFPGITEEELLNEFTGFIEPYVQSDSILKNMSPVIEKKIRFLPGTEIDPFHPITEVIREAGNKAGGRPLEFHGSLFACDAFMFNMYSNTPAVIFGPTGGNAHSTDEYINIADFFNLIEIYALTMAEWCRFRQ